MKTPSTTPINRTHKASGLSRRKLCASVGASSLIILTSCSGKKDTDSLPITNSTSCLLTPEQTEGPYFVDEELNRSDIRTDPSTGTMKEGVPLRLNLKVLETDGLECTELPNAIVDIWHCDAAGVYSDVVDFQGSFDTSGQKFLRGHQITDTNGDVEFITIYPGWYSGRSIHIHFKVRLSSDASFNFASQFYFDDITSNTVHTIPPYAA